MNLSDKDIELIKKLLDEGKPLPNRFRSELFEDAREVELIWQGKSNEVTNVVLPFQSIEQIDEPRKETAEAGASMDMFSVGQFGRQQTGWTNKLIWGDNKLILSSLANGPLRRQIEEAGGLKLVYIDPPFDVGADFNFDIEIGDGETFSKEQSVIEELAYRDTWGRGRESYISMMHERMKLIHSLLASDGIAFVHVGWQVSSLLRTMMEEIFGSTNFVNHIIWKRQAAHSDIGQGSKHLGRLHDSILLCSKTDSFTWNMQFEPYSDEYINKSYRHIDSETGRRYRIDNTSGPGGARKGNPLYEFRGVKKYWRYSIETINRLYDEGRLIQTRSGGDWGYKRYLDEMPGVPLQDIWSDIPPLQSQSREGTGYDTQKPTKLLERIILLASNPGDLVADFFCGSGTTLAVAEKLGRKWIGADLGRFAIHTTRKRMIGVQRELKAADKDYRAFEILNLGKYERQFFIGINPNLPEEEKIKLATQKEEQYLSLILGAYKAERVLQNEPFHGRKGKDFIVVGPLDAPVTLNLVAEAVKACRDQKISNLDILGFDFEMGLSPYQEEEAKKKGVNLQFRYIPRDVFDKRAVEKGQVQFFDLAYLEARAHKDGKKIKVELTDFGVHYRQDDQQDKLDKLKPGGSKVIVQAGQVVKVTKNKDDGFEREILTKEWTDWIDYWAVDFDYFNRAEQIRLLENGIERSIYTGNYIFENEWQSYRTRKDRSLELTSASHEYPHEGRTYTIAIKVIDIFGNDTTKTIQVKI